jgi:hypothetical protein
VPRTQQKGWAALPRRVSQYSRPHAAQDKHIKIHPAYTDAITNGNVKKYKFNFSPRRLNKADILNAFISKLSPKSLSATQILRADGRFYQLKNTLRSCRHCSKSIQVEVYIMLV